MVSFATRFRASQFSSHVTLSTSTWTLHPPTTSTFSPNRRKTHDERYQDLDSRIHGAPTGFSRLVWSDEFSGTSISTANWGYDLGNSGFGNNKWYVDRVQYAEANIAGGINSTSEFQGPFFILLNVAVGGNFVGSPDGTTVFPQQMQVDWVRVWGN